MSEDESEAVGIMAEHGSLLLIRCGSRFAVVERRAGRLYPMKPGAREGAPMTAAGMASLMAEEGPLPEEEARQLFKKLCERGDRLARHLW